MKIGILGPGKIAQGVVYALKQMPEIECYAVASRTPGKAEAFAREHGFQKIYNRYEDMVQDPEVELIYVATPHSHHFEHMMLCLTHGKPVICEKAFTMNAKQAQAIRDYSETHGIFAAEAIWPRYMPSRGIIQDALNSGKIGKVYAMTANLHYKIDDVPRIRLPELAGGALLDVGIYGLSFALTHFDGEIERIESSVQLTDTGVDGMESITIHFTDGKIAMLTHGIYTRSDRKGIFYGEKGYIVVENINNPQSVSIFDDNDQLLEFHAVPEQINGYEYEFREAVRCIREGKHEAPSISLAESVRVMAVMDQLRAQWGVVYPQERE
ncbi:MAG: Gfo/Idh/MocA family oxidoreductase [Oscillospiraceae bacterium]|nr:Gfo/Idh/MocA family oxidoreductase [Oscillospiraceae bacterium]